MGERERSKERRSLEMPLGREGRARERERKRGGSREGREKEDK